MKGNGGGEAGSDLRNDLIFHNNHFKNRIILVLNSPFRG